MLEFPIYHKDENFLDPTEDIYYIVASNGLFLVKKTKFFISSSCVWESRGKGLEWLKPHRSEISLRFPKKIPVVILEKTVNFFRVVCKKHDGAEAIVLLYWNEEAENYEIAVPEQKVAKSALPFYKIGPTPNSFMRLGTIHSHGTMGAFHSHVDKKDEEHEDGVHITVGTLNSLPTFSCELVSDGTRVGVELEDIFDLSGEMAVPEEWLEKVETIEVSNKRHKR